MKTKILSGAIVILIVIHVNLSCKKESSCEGCNENNKPPIAIAGPDQVITLPTDSVSLDGSASNDPDGTISGWLWKKISGPGSYNVIKPNDSMTLVKNLKAGVHQFELKVTDNEGLFSKDTVQVFIDDPSNPNRPPIADAGPDQNVTLPIQYITLDAGNSSDPDHNITAFWWSKISGPFVNFDSINASQLQIHDLVEGVYLFQLKVTDAGGLFAMDTMKVYVNAVQPQPSPCNNSWPTINGTIGQIGSLSEPRQPIVSSNGNKVVFAGGWKYGVCGFGCDEADFGSSAVDIYDMASQTWSVTQLSKARGAIATIATGNKIFFAGGYSWECGYPMSLHVSYSNVDIYDVSTNTWEFAHLSKARSHMATAAVGNKVLFAGGSFFTGDPFSQLVWDITNRVDIYDIVTNQWSTATLSSASMNIKANTIGNKVYFDYHNGIIDVYDNISNTWTTSDLQNVIASLLPPPGMGIVDGFDVLGDNIIFWNYPNQVGIRNLATGITSIACMSGLPAFCLVNDNIVFFEEATRFSIYKTITGTWSDGRSGSPIPVYANNFPSVVSGLTNTTYFGGGGDCPGYENKVYKLTW